MHIAARNRKATLSLALLLCLLPSAVLRAAEENEPATIADALRASQQQHRPVLVDFHAVWCYSCYYMASHVLTGADWEAVKRKAIVVDADADSPDGQLWMTKLKASFLPSYVVLDANGNELGRVSAEQPRDKFYPQINAILATGNTLDRLKASADKGSIDAVAGVLETYQARGEGEAGLAWFGNLPGSLQQHARKQARVVLALDQLALARSVEAGDNKGIVEHAQKVLAGDVGCLRPYVLDDLLRASNVLPAAGRNAVLSAQRQPFDRYLDSQVLSAQPACADQRSAVLASADLDKALGDTTAESRVLDRAIQLTRQRLGNQLASDRNLADNLRVYLTRAGRTSELDDYQRKLIAAYPDDYVYAYRYGRSLLESGKPAEALPYLAQAAEKAYGANRLAVASQRVKALKALHRDDEAKKIVADVLETNGPWFPKQVSALKAQLNA